MDGSGILLKNFADRLAESMEVLVVEYPCDRALGYPELETLARSRLPVGHPFVLIAESFSGPIAIALAAANPSGLCGVVFVCSFATSPVFLPKPFRLGVVSLALVLPVRIAAEVVLHGFLTWELYAQFRSVIKTITPAVLRARMHAVLSIDVSSSLSKIRVPMLYLRAMRDLIVPKSAINVIAQSASMRIVNLDGPHCLLQARPDAAAAEVRVFVRELLRYPGFHEQR